jgi:hypothetical protein
MEQYAEGYKEGYKDGTYGAPCSVVVLYGSKEHTMFGEGYRAGYAASRYWRKEDVRLACT